MGQPSYQASNAIIYLTYGAFLYDRRILPTSQMAADLVQWRRATGVWISWLRRRQSKADFLSSNRTQKGQDSNCLVAMRDAYHFTPCPATASQICLFAVYGLILTNIVALPLALNFIASGECISAVIRV